MGGGGGQRRRKKRSMCEGIGEGPSPPPSDPYYCEKGMPSPIGLRAKGPPSMWSPPSVWSLVGPQGLGGKGLVHKDGNMVRTLLRL